MCLLIETIKILNGNAENIFWHNKRFNLSRLELFGIKKPISLEQIINVPEEYRNQEVKCRITYGEKIESIEFEPYIFRTINSLKVISDDNIDYTYKYKNRSAINSLFGKRASNDDILIVKNGLVTDSSYCNLVFSENGLLYTPWVPLLNGCKRQKYLSEGMIKEKVIRVEEISIYSCVHLINSFCDLGRCVVPIENISF